MVFQAVSDGWSLPLNGVVVNIDDFDQLLERDKPDVVLLVCKEATKNVDCEDAQSLTSLDDHDCTDTFSKDRVARVLACLCVSSNLG